MVVGTSIVVVKPGAVMLKVAVFTPRHVGSPVDNALSDVSIDFHFSLVAVAFRLKPKAAVDDGARAVR